MAALGLSRSLVRRRRLLRDDIFGDVGVWELGIVWTNVRCLVLRVRGELGIVGTDIRRLGDLIGQDCVLDLGGSRCVGAWNGGRQVGWGDRTSCRNFGGGFGLRTVAFFGDSGSRTSSMTAMGALSPLRAPILVMRV